MALTKTHTSVENGTTLTAGAADDVGASNDVTGSYGGALLIKLTNGATGPTVAAQVQVQVSTDNSKWYDLGGALVGTTGNDDINSWEIEYGLRSMYVRTIQGSNTGQDVTVDIDISKVTAI